MRDGDVVWSRWEEVDRLFDRLLEVPEAERRAAAERLCAGDEALRHALLDLLERSEMADERATAPGPDLVREACDPDAPRADDPTLGPGHRLGRYRLGDVLGQGGMATVYEAERDDGAYRQAVALKVLRRGLDTDRIVARFLAERQILSDFAHPNIARLLDGGATPDGRPFLVVEKVDGTPITAWADEAGLSVEQRLWLFLQVTSAVREAHRRLVVHRDLKPSNILVDRSGTVKLLDFGIAKLLDAEAGSDLTELAAPLTESYASPEQIRGDPVTISSDVYQLGLILHELVTGVRPFGTGSVGEERQRGDAPAPPSRAVGSLEERPAGAVARKRSTTRRALRQALLGDLDTIIRKALEPEPLERYGSVDELAGDIRLHLSDRPIRARPASRRLRVRKWVRRNAWAPPVAAGLLLAVAGYVGTVTVTARRLEAERNAATEQVERAERIKGFLIDLFRSADPWAGPGPEAGAAMTVVEALDDAAERIETELRGRPALQADLLAGVASIFANLDRTDEGRPHVERAIELRSRLGETTSAAYASDLQVLAQIEGTEDPDSAIALRERAVETLRAAVATDDPRLAEALAGLFGVQVRQRGLHDPTLGEEALAIYEAAGDAYRIDQAAVLVTLAQAHQRAGRLDAAEEAARASLTRMRGALGSDHVRTAVSGAVLAGVLDDRQRFTEAVPIYRESLERLERGLGPTHNQTLSTRNNLATTLHALRRFDEAAAIHREIVDAQRTKAGTEVHASVANSLQNLAGVLKDAGSLTEADSLAQRAHEIYVATTPEGHYLRAFPLLTRTEILLEREAYREAEEMAGRALGILERALPAGHYATEVARCRLGAALVGQGSVAEAVEHVRAALSVLRVDERTPPDYLAECEEAASRLGVG